MKAPTARPACAARSTRRVSTDARLEQEFNSLDAQREASEAYIKSQTHEGWSLVRARYDDGGFSGGSMERPALQKLLLDVQAKRIDVIVVYKVDRLTRSLADFAKLVELFDAHGVSFVSVTQSFNTTTSMGRLTLNVLLSFAQFEREVTGRADTRQDRRLEEKGHVDGRGGSAGLPRRRPRPAHRRGPCRTRPGPVQALSRSRQRRSSKGTSSTPRTFAFPSASTARGDRPAAASSAAAISTRSSPTRSISARSPIRASSTKASTRRSSIASLWDKVQQSLEDHLAAKTQRRERQSTNALLVGKLFDDRGNLMTPSWSKRGSKRWRYYVSQAILRGDKANAGSVARVSAPEIESRVIEAIGSLDQGQNSQAIHPGRHPARDDIPPAQNADTPPDHHERIRSRIERVTLERAAIRIALSHDTDQEAEAKVLTIAWAAPSPYRRREIIHGTSAGSSSARPLPQALVSSHQRSSQSASLVGRASDRPEQTVESIAARESKSERSIRMTLSLAFLSPDLVKAAIDGRLPRGFGLTRLIDLPIAWSDQWAALGLKAPARA